MKSVLFALVASLAAVSARRFRKDSKPLLEVVYQFPNLGSWGENLAVRPNGDILVTRADVAELWSISPKSQTASLVYTFPDANTVHGITLIDDDRYAIAALKMNLTTVKPELGSSTIWGLDFKKKKTGTVSVIKKIPELVLPNGLATLNAKAGVILIADSVRGQILRLNTNTGEYSVALKDPTMDAAVGAPVPIGVNGVKVHDGFVYYTSSTKMLFARIPTDKNANATGPAEVVAQGFFADDFALTKKGVAYVATNPLNTILKIEQGGTTSVAAGSLTSLDVAGTTACQFAGKGEGEDGPLYCVTDGALPAPVNGTLTEPAKVVLLRVGSCN